MYGLRVPFMALLGKMLWYLAPWVLILTVISFIVARHLNAQELGDDIAVGLGVPLTKSRVFMLLLSTALIGEQLPSPEGLDLSV